MNYGFVKVAAAVPRVKVADCKFNSERLEGLITIAEGKGVQILTFPEMCITGYTCGDLFAQQLLLEQAEMALIQILNSTRQLDIISILGMPVVVNSTVINAAVVIQKGKILGVVPKTYLPNYKEFYEQRWFTSALQVSENSVRLCGQIVPMGNNLLFETAETTFGIEICEDLWATVPPSSSLALQGAEIIFNLSADDEGIGKHNYLCSLISQQSARRRKRYMNRRTSLHWMHAASPVMFFRRVASVNRQQMLFLPETDLFTKTDIYWHEVNVSAWRNS